MFNKRNCGCGCNQQGFGMPNDFERQGMMDPIVEPMVNNCVEKDFYCEVPHVCPINTHTINRVHYVHTYTPKYTCTEETQVINDDCGSCCNFR